MTRGDLQYLLLIGAYRDNEVNAAHPLIRKLQPICEAGVTVGEIKLAPPRPRDMMHFVADSLHSEPEHVAPLAQLIHEKTAGNPFFAIQFLSAIAEEGLLIFDHGEGRWSLDLSRIETQGYTDNVVDLMMGKLSRLPRETPESVTTARVSG